VEGMGFGMDQCNRMSGNTLRRLTVETFHWKRFLGVLEGSSAGQPGEHRWQEEKFVALEAMGIAGLGGNEGSGVPRSPSHCLR
jgi:hypothetical protein